MTGRVDHLEATLARYGLGLARWSPGDGSTRYRITEGTSTPFHYGDGLYTGTLREVEAWTRGLVHGYGLACGVAVRAIRERKEGIR